MTYLQSYAYGCYPLDPIPLPSLLWGQFEQGYKLPTCANTTNDTHFSDLSKWLSVLLHVDRAKPGAVSFSKAREPNHYYKLFSRWDHLR